MPSKLFMEVVRSPGLAHISYMIGQSGQAAVIDARRDCQPYIDLARKHDCRITHIFETHRNEDYITGSVELQRRTGAEIHHGEGLDWGFGGTVTEGDEFYFGNARLRVLQTPGHTDESISLVLADTNSADAPLAVFTGDCLFIGDVGRTDFYPDRPEEVAGLLYDSIFDKLLPLGDGVILCPAHGAGSVCGSGMASRDFSTLGFEKQQNPSLQVSSRDAFIKMKTSEHHYQPPYFRQMEQYNQHGSAPATPILPAPQSLTPDELEDARDRGAIVLDVREPEAFAGAFIPGTINIPKDMIAAYAGWLLPYETDIVLVVEDPVDVDEALRPLIRLGYDKIAGYLHGGPHNWETRAGKLETIGIRTARDLKGKLDTSEAPTILDVRKDDEWQAGHLPDAKHIYLGYLPDKLDEVPRNGEVVTFCGSGRRATIAASLLKRAGYENVSNNLGSMAACKAVGCKIVQ